MKTLCLYYSRTNLTRVIMKRVAMLTDADLYEYTDGVDRTGILGYLRTCIDSYKKAPKIHIVGGEPDWEEYDRVIVGMPVWAEKPSVVGTGFLEQYSDKFCGKLYLVVTHMAGFNYDKKIRKAYAFSKVEPQGHLSVQTKDHDPDIEIKRFVRSLDD